MSPHFPTFVKGIEACAPEVFTYARFFLAIVIPLFPPLFSFFFFFISCHSSSLHSRHYLSNILARHGPPNLPSSLSLLFPRGGEPPIQIYFFIPFHLPFPPLRTTTPGTRLAASSSFRRTPFVISRTPLRACPLLPPKKKRKRRTLI